MIKSFLSNPKTYDPGWVLQKQGGVAGPVHGEQGAMRLVGGFDCNYLRYGAMPVQFLTSEQRANYGRYIGDPNADELTRYFYLDDADHAVIGAKRGRPQSAGFALQLTSVRFLGTFIEDPLDVPDVVLQTLVRQLRITNIEQLPRYRSAGHMAMV